MNKKNESRYTRRQLISHLGGLAILSCLPLSTALAKVTPSRSLYFYHIHTGEKGRFTYWENGQYIPEARLEISWLLRDFRTDEMKVYDKHLLDQLYVIQHLTDSNKGFEVISGYRSPATNAKLFTMTDGVDENSLHMQGRAIDVRPYGVSLQAAHKAALSLRAGGVGYYPKTTFMHLDTGKVQQWVWR